MNKSELKDGMVLEFEDGDIATVYNNASRYAYFDKSPSKSFNRLDSSSINCLEFDSEGEIVGDLVRVFYMGEVLWERKGSLTLQEAISSGLQFKHSDCTKFTYFLSEATSELEDVGEEKEIPSCIKIADWVLSEMKKKVWEVKQ